MNQYVDDIQDHVRSAPWSNIRVDAFAGCGKSTFLAGLTHDVLTERERGRTGYTAFQRDVVDLMRPKIADGVACMTIHGAGLGALMQAYPRSEVYQSKYHYIIKDRIEEYQIKEWKLRAEWSNATKKLLEKVMVEVVREPNEEVLMEIADHYSIDLPYDGGEAVDLIDHCLDLGRTQLKRRIAFVDMIYWPIVDNLPMKETCETLLVDEAQDFSEAHWQMVKKLADGRIIYVGDSLQCHPAGTMVMLSSGEYMPIECLEEGDKVVCYDRGSSSFVKNGHIEAVGTRPYSGRLYTVSAAGKQVKCTDNHKFLVRWNKQAENKWVTYIMRQGQRFRVGRTQMFVKTSGGMDFGLGYRARQEGADDAWVLAVHDSIGDALAHEQIISAVYGIPQVCFQKSWGTTHFDQTTIDKIYNGVGPTYDRVVQCLKAYGRSIVYPLWSSRGKQQRQGRRTLFETQACNLIDGYMMIPVPPEVINSKRRTATWEPIGVTDEWWEGQVYSLEVAKHHNYIANGLVVCNCIFGFSGSKLGGMDLIGQELQAMSFPLPICYRCPISHVKLAQWHAKGMQWRPDAPEGTIKYLNRIEDLFGPRWKWEPGQVTLCRTRRPLIEMAHKLVQQRIPVAVKGSALDDGLLSLLDRVTGRKGVRWSTLQWDIEDYRDEKVGQMERRESDQMAIDEFKDKCDSLSTLTRMAKELLVDDIKGLEQFIKDLFEKDPHEKVILATFHTFKGAEADTVIRIRPDLIPHPKAKKAWEQDQERNLDYIGNTRSKDTLVFVKAEKNHYEGVL